MKRKRTTFVDYQNLMFVHVRVQTNTEIAEEEEEDYLWKLSNPSVLSSEFTKKYLDCRGRGNTFANDQSLDFFQVRAQTNTSYR